VAAFWQGARALFGGFATTFVHLFRRPITVQYPEERRPLPARTRFRIVLTRDPDGNERCVACYLCSAVCPVSCISMQSTAGEQERRRAAWFRINFSRCIFCGLCEEACPEEAIFLSDKFEYAGRTREEMIFHKEKLLEIGGIRVEGAKKWKKEGNAGFHREGPSR
jgi:NADH-quinone oxidoreductase subunit I